MRAIFWDLCADLNRDLPRMRRRFYRLNYRGMHQRQSGAFSFFGADTPGPEFRGISRERGRRSLTRHAQGSDPPRGRTLLHGEAGKPTSAVGVASPKAVPRRGGGLTFGRRAAATGGLAVHGGAVSAAGWATLGRSGGARRAEAGAGGQKSRTHGASGVPGVCAGAGVPGKTGASRGSIRARAGQKKGGTGAKRGVRAGKKAETAGVGGKKAPFCREKGGQRGCAGAKTGGKSWRRV